MVALKVEPDKLPKSSDLKAHLFPSTLSISVSEQDIRLVSRGAFPDLSLPIGLVPLAAVMPAMKSVVEKLQQIPAATPSEAATGATAAGPSSQPGATGAVSSAPGGAAPAAPSTPPPGARRRRGRSGDD
jgi:hypothetical protein